MRRVVVTGMGIISSIGNDINEVTESLKTGRSGLSQPLTILKKALGLKYMVCQKLM
jgi:3-oxoacyl-[acyl-carrier-protein] synthase-1